MLRQVDREEVALYHTQSVFSKSSLCCIRRYQAGDGNMNDTLSGHCS